MKLRLLFILLLFAGNASADPLLRLRRPLPQKKIAFSTSGMGIVSFFTTDPRHSAPAIPRTGFGLNGRVEFIFSEQFRIFTGFDLLSQSCSFNTYYFAQGHSFFYDNNYNYLHSLRTFELHWPVLFRVGLTRDENDANNSVYFLAGWAMKYQMGARSTVLQITSGQEVWSGKAQMDFENWFLTPRIGNVLVGGLGFNKRFNHSEESVFFEAVYRYGLSRSIYYGNGTSNELLIRNASLSLAVGFRI